MKKLIERNGVGTNLDKVDAAARVFLLVSSITET